MSCVMPQRGFLEVYTRTSSHMSFPFVDCTLYPFVVICHRHECNYMLSPVGPPTKSLFGGFTTQTCFNFSRSLCYWSPQCWHKGHMNRVAMVAEIKAIYRPNTIIFHSPRVILPAAYCHISNLTATQNNAEPPIQHHP